MDLRKPFRDACSECLYYHKENNTCQSKKCSGHGDGYVTFWDRVLCKPLVLTEEDYGDAVERMELRNPQMHR